MIDARLYRAALRAITHASDAPVGSDLRDSLDALAEACRAIQETAPDASDSEKAKRERKFVYLPRTVRGDFPFQRTFATPGVYEAYVNPHGAVRVRATNGSDLGVKPGEFEWALGPATKQPDDRDRDKTQQAGCDLADDRRVIREYTDAKKRT